MREVTSSSLVSRTSQSSKAPLRGAFVVEAPAPSTDRSRASRARSTTRRRVGGRRTVEAMEDRTAPQERVATPPAEAAERLIAGVLALGLPEVWTVGGVERDRLLGRPQKDVDLLVCGVSPDELMAVCRSAGHRPQPLEVAGRLVGVRLRAAFTGPEGAELALARTEVSTGEGHTEFEIVPVPVPEHLRGVPPGERAGDPALREAVLADLGRRDFTCNAIARNARTGELVDPYGGTADIAAGIVRAISPDSFRDDALRAFRLLARIAKDGTAADATTVRLVREAARTMAIQGLPGPDGVVPPEPERVVETVAGRDGRSRRVVRRGPRASLTQDRIHDELVKTLCGPHAATALRRAVEWGLLQRILPEFEPTVGFEHRNHHHALTVDEHQLRAVASADRSAAPWSLKLALLMHDAGKPLAYQDHPDGGRSFRGHERVSAELARAWAPRLRLARSDQADVVHLIAHHMFAADQDFARHPRADQDRRARRFLAEHGVRLALLLADHRRHDRSAKDREPLADDDPALADVRAFRDALERNREHPSTLRDLAVGGRDLQELGVPPGPAHGEILRALLDVVLDDPTANDPARLRRIAEGRLAAAPATDEV